MSRLLTGSFFGGVAWLSSTLLLLTALGLHTVSDEEAASLYGGTSCKYTPNDNIEYCGIDQDPPCQEQGCFTLTMGGGSRGHVKYCSNNGTDICGKMYEPQACNP